MYNCTMHMKMGVVLLGRRGSVRGRTEVAISYAHTQSDHGSQAGKDLLVFFVAMKHLKESSS